MTVTNPIDAVLEKQTVPGGRTTDELCLMPSSETLSLVEVVFAHVVARRVFAQRATARESAGMALVVAGVALLLLTV